MNGRTIFLSSILSASFLLLSSSASAQLLVDHQSDPGLGRMELTPSLSFSEVEYDFDGGGDADIERSIIGLALNYGVGPSFNVFGELGYIAEAELENSRSDGNGGLFGFGLHGEFYRNAQLSLRWLGGLHYITEDYGSGIDGELLEVKLGFTARTQIIDRAGLYGGFDLIPLSEGEIQPSGTRDRDFDRDRPIGLRVGADYRFENGMKLNAEVAAVSEEVFLLRLTVPL